MDEFTAPAETSKVRSSLDLPGTYELIKLMGLDKSSEQVARDEQELLNQANENLKAQLETERRLREVLEQQRNWQPALEARIRDLEECNKELRELLEIKAKESLLHYEAEEQLGGE